MNIVLMSLMSLLFLVSCLGPGDEYNPMGGLSSSRILSSSKTWGGIYFDYSVDKEGCNVTLREQSMQRLRRTSPITRLSVKRQCRTRRD